MEINEKNNFKILFPFFCLGIESFNGANEKSILLFGSLNGSEQNEQEKTPIPLYFLKISNFHSSQNWEEWEK